MGSSDDRENEIEQMTLSSSDGLTHQALAGQAGDGRGRARLEPVGGICLDFKACVSETPFGRVEWFLFNHLI